MQKSLDLNYLINISPKKPNLQPKHMNSMHAKLTQKPLDQIGTKGSAQCALCKFFLVAKPFHRLNTSITRPLLSPDFRSNVALG